MKFFIPPKILTKKKIYHLLLIITTTLLIITSQIFSPQTNQVFAQPPSSVKMANSWSNASFPVENFQRYTSGFGYRRSATGGSGSEFHSGLDIAAPLGSYIRNWWGGEIVDLSDHTACGTMITMGSGPWLHLYCHLMGHVENRNNQLYLVDTQGGILLMKGQQIPGGARIGRVGMTGRTTGPHLHWGLKHNGEYLDPAVVLRAMYQQQTS
jgi:murein DD-endopeptidase MepM/ murein hydrolase activator NlpD